MRSLTRSFGENYSVLYIERIVSVVLFDSTYTSSVFFSSHIPLNVKICISYVVTLLKTLNI